MQNLILSPVAVEELVDMIACEVETRLLRPNESKKNDPKYLSRKDVSQLLHISLPTLNEYTHKGIIKGSRIGSRVLYSESEIKQAVKDIPARKYKRGKW